MIICIFVLTIFQNKAIVMAETGYTGKIRVILADDHEIVRAGMKRLISIDKDIEIVDEAKNGQEAVELVTYHKPDIAILDILMPRMNGIDAAAKIKEKFPEILVIMLTAFEDHDHVENAISAGANGYLIKDISAKELTKAIRQVMNGERVFTNSIIKLMQKKYVKDSSDSEKSIVITKREQEILNLVAKGKTSPEIAEVLFISTRTVESHRYNLMQKLGVKNAAGLVRYAVSQSKSL